MKPKLVRVSFMSGSVKVPTVPITRVEAARYIRHFRKTMRPDLIKTLKVERA